MSLSSALRLSRRSLATLPVLAKTAAEVASKPVKSTAPTASVTEALAVMTGKFGALAVMNESDGHSRSELHGIITERDFLNKVQIEGTRFSMFEPAVADLMTPKSVVQFAKGSWSLEQCLSVMLEGGFRHLPVGEPGRLEGMLSLRDIAKIVAEGASPASDPAIGQVAMAATARLQSASAGMELPPSIAAVERGATVSEAVQLMRDRKVGSVLVPNHGKTLADSRSAFAIFTERDFLKLLIAAAADGSDPRQRLVSEFATPSDTLQWVEPGMTAFDALQLMASRGLRHLPVRQPPTWIWRPGMGELLKHSTSQPAPPALLAVVSMRELCTALC